ncbi:MAG: hypothetical protein JJT82_02110 [Legionellaceae bacterium]|nr:hypothetical protein [Legionellaceae bacterium]
MRRMIDFEQFGRLERLDAKYDGASTDSGDEMTGLVHGFPYSFLQYSEETKEQLRLFSAQIPTSTLDELLKRQEMPNARLLHQQRDALEASYRSYERQCATLNPACAPFLPEASRLVWQDKLRMLIWFGCLQYRLDRVERRRDKLDEYRATIAEAQLLLHTLEQRETAHSASSLLLPAISEPTRYVGVAAAKLIPAVIAKLRVTWQENRAQFEQLLRSWQEGKSKALIEWMSDVNGLRLYWVWGNSLLDTIFIAAHKCGRIDDSYFAYLEKLLQSPNPVTGNMSWILYYARFTLNFLLLFKHSIPQPFMSAEEEELPRWHELLRSEWNRRKYQLINDSVWGTANLACYFWLTYRASARMGMIGDYLTALLLVMDLALTILKYIEETQKYEQLHANMQAQLRAIAKELQEESSPLQRARLTEHQQSMRAEMARLEHEWYYQKLSMYNELFYAAGLLVSFCLLIGLFTPVGLLSPAALMLIGAVSCFVLTVLNRAIETFLPVFKKRSEIQQLKEEYAKGLEDFQHAVDDNRQKEVFLHLADLQQQILYHQQYQSFQMMLGLHGLVIDSLTPVAVLATLILLPVGAGIATLSAAFVLTLVSRLLLNRLEPKAPEFATFDEHKYQFFKAEQKNANLASEAARLSSGGEAEHVKPEEQDKSVPQPRESSV